MSMHPCTYCTTKWTQKGENALEVEREKWWGSWMGTRLVIGVDQNTLCIVIKHSIKYLFTNNKVLRFILSHFYSLSFFYLSFICVFILFYLIQLPFFFCSVQRHWKETTTSSHLLSFLSAELLSRPYAGVQPPLLALQYQDQVKVLHFMLSHWSGHSSSYNFAVARACRIKVYILGF